MALERLEINGDVGKFRHDSLIIEPVRTFVTLAAGWIIGGVIVVLLDGRALTREPTVEAAVSQSRTAARAAERLDAGRPPRLSGRIMVSRAAGAAIAIPVAGIRASDLRDTFTERRSGNRSHGAIDILAPRGTPVVAAVDGTIRKIFESRAGGLTVYQFDSVAQRVYYYAHLDAYAEGLGEGDAVLQGTVLGYVGTTGNAPPDTPHLHFSVEDLPPSKEWWKGTPVNPYPLLAGAGPEPSGAR